MTFILLYIRINIISFFRYNLKNNAWLMKKRKITIELGVVEYHDLLTLSKEQGVAMKELITGLISDYLDDMFIKEILEEDEL